MGLSTADTHKETNRLSLLELCIYMLQYLIKHLEAYKMVWRSMPCDRDMYKSNWGKILLISLYALLGMCQYCLCQVIPFLSTGGLGTNHSQPHHTLCTCQCISFLLQLCLCHPLFSFLSSALQVPMCFASSSAIDVTQISHFLCPTPQKCPTLIPVVHITDITLNTSEV